MSRLPRGGPGPAEAVGVLAALVGLEMALSALLPAPAGRAGGLWQVGAVRAAEMLAVAGFGAARGWGPAALGLGREPLRRGLRVGAGFCAAMGLTVLAAEGALRLAGAGSFLARLAGPRPAAAEWLPLLAVGGGVAPVFEELVFRGVLYGALRRRVAALPAALAVTALFAAAHLPTAGVPWVQAVGGLVFCAAYELSGSLWAPVLVHAAGNLALFLLPLVV